MAFDFLKRSPRISKTRLRQFEERRILEEARKGMDREKRKKILGGVKRFGGEAQRRFTPSQKQFQESKWKVMREAGRFAGTGAREEEPFTKEQEALKSVFGGGEKIWGWKNEPVEIHNDLHPSLSKDDETASIFGFGGRR